MTKSTSVLGRLPDGTIQITITIPESLIKQTREKVVDELIQEIEVPGFRKGKAPRDLATKHLDTQEVYNHILQHLLPEVYADSVKEYKLKPILAPRFELVSQDVGKDWTVRAITCEIPTVDIGNYKQTVVGQAKADKIWIPGEDKEKPKEKTREEKEQKVIDAIIKNIKAKIPQPLVDEEINHRLSKLLDQTQKLGITIEQYLASTGKTVDKMREEYATQAKEAITLELGLNKIAEAEGVKIEDKEIDEAINAVGDEKTKENLKTPRQRSLIHGVLLRRKALDRLITLV